MHVVFLAPGYPPEMPHYVRGLAQVGAQVTGVGDGPPEGLPPLAQRYLHDYVRVPGLLDEDDLVARVVAAVRGAGVQRVETLWEPLVTAAARIREALGISGMSLDVANRFRDKQLMKERLAAAGLRVPRSERVRTADDARAAAQRIGFPLILKPISGAGSADTFRVDDDAELEATLQRMGHVVEASCEEFVEGDEYTYDTVCIDGEPVFENVAQYLPRPLDARSHEWISPIICTVRDLDRPELQRGLELGRAALKALGMGTGFTHMEWYRKADGEVVFGEIGCRPGGAHLVDQMNFTCDVDLFREWARAVCWEHFEGRTDRRYNCAIIFKRAQGEGRIFRIEGIDRYMEQFGPGIVWENLLPVGAKRRNWRHTLVSDGFLMVRHPDWDEALHMARAAASDVALYAAP